MEPYQVQELFMGLMASGTIIFLAFSPIARALGTRIMHGRIPAPGATPLPDPRLDDVLDENAMLRRQLEEVQERVSFAERMLAQQQGRGVLPGA